LIYPLAYNICIHARSVMATSKGSVQDQSLVNVVSL
jgi:hypothetical protein